MYSFVAEITFSPVDIDLASLSRGEWNPLTDRFRVWFLPNKESEGSDVCYVMIRKFDQADEVLTVAHIVVNSAKDGAAFTIGIMSNDDVRARTLLNATLGIPPAFHQRSELKLVERRWRTDPEALYRYIANIDSVSAGGEGEKAGGVYKLSFEPPPGVEDDFRRSLASWWAPAPTESAN